LVRIWEVDVAVLQTNKAVASMSASTHAAYASQTSTIARGKEPIGRGETAVPIGDGTLWIAEEWSVDALVALNTDLVAAGAPRLTEGQPVQVPPHFPEDMPEEMGAVCSKVRLPGPGVEATDAP
jgi:hypothetical protein